MGTLSEEMLRCPLSEGVLRASLGKGVLRGWASESLNGGLLRAGLRGNMWHRRKLQVAWRRCPRKLVRNPCKYFEDSDSLKMFEE